MREIADKVVLVTGGGDGIGAALAREAAARGAKVAVTDIDLAKAQAVAEELSGKGATAHAVKLDVTSPNEWSAAVAEVERRLGPVDVLCSNAGVGPVIKSLLDLPVGYLRWIYEVNMLGMVNAVQCVAPGMLARGSGHILVTASVASFTGGGMQAGYTSSKNGLIALCDSLRSELTGSGVGISAICPAGVITTFADSTRDLMPPELSRGMAAELKETHEKFTAYNESGASITPAEVARRAFNGMLAGDYYIFTQLDSREMTLKRSEEIRRVFDALAAKEGAPT